jgi:hypothetical protein
MTLRGDKTIFLTSVAREQFVFLAYFTSRNKVIKAPDSSKMWHSAMLRLAAASKEHITFSTPASKPVP